MSYRLDATPQTVAATPCRCVKSRSESGSRQAASEASLGTTAKSVGRSADEKSSSTPSPAIRRRAVRADRYRWQRHAAQLLGYRARVGLCRYAVQSRARGVGVIGSTYGDDPTVYASFEGLQTCGSVWHCPLCAARISETRRSEMNALLTWARARRYVVRMITLTARHGAADDLADLLDRLKDAKRRLHQHRRWKAIKGRIVGSVTASEVTGGGRHGWHPHLHMIVIMQRGSDALDLHEPWLGALRGAGLDGTGAAYDEQDAQAAGAYIAKGSWGAAEEITLSGRKRGRVGGGRSPAQLLAASCDDGDTLAGVLWAEYARVFQGRRQLVWSRGLRDLACINKIDDEEAAQDDGQDEQVSAEIARIDHRDWRGRSGAQRRRARVLDAAETDGAAGVASVVADDSDDYARTEDDFDVIDTSDGTDLPAWTPIVGGVAATALAAVRPLPGQGP